MKLPIFSLAIKSIRYRRSTILMSVFSIALSVMLLLGIERLRTNVEESFTSTISGTDLIVGARTGNLSLLLSTVFHIGNATQNVNWETYQRIANMPQVAWTIPISLGDSHKGYPVIGTTSDLFKYYKYSANYSLSASEGKTNIYDMNCVIGSSVAEKLGYAVNDSIVLTHGMGSEDFTSHGDDPFTIAGVLRPTGTPIDNSILISMSALDHIHDEFYSYGDDNSSVFGDFEFKPDPKKAAAYKQKQEAHTHEESHDHEHEGHNHTEHHEDHGGHKHEGHDHNAHNEEGHSHEEHNHDQHHHDEHNEEGHSHKVHEQHEHNQNHHDSHDGHDHAHGEPGSVTGFFLGVKNKSDILGLQRQINDDKTEALLAILPAITLVELWQIIKPIEKILLIISLLVLLVSLGSVLTSILSSLNQRRREMAVLRSVGAQPKLIFGLIILESVGIVLAGLLLGLALLIFALVFTQPILAENFGMMIEIGRFSDGELLILLAIAISGVLVGLIPALQSYRRTLSDGLTIKT